MGELGVAIILPIDIIIYVSMYSVDIFPQTVFTLRGSGGLS